MPGFAGLKNKVQLSTSLLLNLCLHGAHKCPNNASSQSKAMWVDYTRKQFNIGNIVSGCMPCQICELWNIPNYHLKMKDRILRIAEYFNDKYMLQQANESNEAEFTDSEIYGHRVIMEREAALAAHVEKSAVEAGAHKRDQRAKHNAEVSLNLLLPGRGVSYPSGVNINECESHGLAALARQPVSTALSKSNSLYSHAAER